MTDQLPELWAAVGNIRKTTFKGPDETQALPGTKHFRGGAKVYVISAFEGGGSHTLTVIGQERKSRSFILVHIQAKFIETENLRPKLVYHPTVRKLMLDYYSNWETIPGRQHAEGLCIPSRRSTGD